MSQQNQNATAKDAVALLTSDHDKVKKLFREFEKCDAAHQGLKHDLAQQICMDLTIHATIEEEIFYPAVRAETGEQQQVDEALEEHGSIKELVEHIRGMAAGDGALDGAVQQLRACVEHHVSEEEQEMFPQVRQSDADLADLCAQLQERKEELEHDFGATPVRGNDTAEAEGERSATGQAGS
ncbi:Hemerythrin HHE cation binding domain-containing protein [Duganella sp. CF458]|uniref:hemerythrin domain-containing protein n=1 Tax=Duganella sp. CF458 TaxID=1884368 RepID=UPI0008F0B03E|nr:hemerythrin domain-containing protein [Duganella sp. CF458]SFF84092.1 Hemerythrin HHE cation binding domain-containing protein [Duganella sp. CF458]